MNSDEYRARVLQLERELSDTRQDLDDAYADNYLLIYPDEF